MPIMASLSDVFQNHRLILRNMKGTLNKIIRILNLHNGNLYATIWGEGIVKIIVKEYVTSEGKSLFANWFIN